MIKIGAKSFIDGSQNICEGTESNLGPFAGFKAEIIQKQALFQFLAEQLAKNNYELESIMQSALIFLSLSFPFAKVIFSSISRKESSEKKFLFKV